MVLSIEIECEQVIPAIHVTAPQLSSRSWTGNVINAT
jgi:hypothetical protein